MRDDIFGMLYPLAKETQKILAQAVKESEEKFTSFLAELANQGGYKQIQSDNNAAWIDESGVMQVMFFRILDPGKIDAIRSVYDTIKENKCPLAYVFIHQIPDGDGTWDIFRLSERSYMEHCNRVSGPGSWCGD